MKNKISNFFFEIFFWQGSPLSDIRKKIQKSKKNFFSKFYFSKSNFSIFIRISILLLFLKCSHFLTFPNLLVTLYRRLPYIIRKGQNHESQGIQDGGDLTGDMKYPQCGVGFYAVSVALQHWLSLQKISGSIIKSKI